MLVICPKCGKIIDATSSKEVAFCSQCGSNFSISDGKKLFDRQYALIARQAYVELNEKGEYDAAIEDFNKCLEMKKSDLSAIIGISLATLYKQDFLNINFDKIQPIFDKYDIYLNEENTFLFCSFIEDVLKETKKYLKEANSRLFRDGKSIGSLYLDNYEKSLKDILGLINFLVDGLLISSEEEKKVFYEDHNLDNDLNELKNYVLKLSEIRHEVMEEEETLDDNRIIIVNKKAIKTYKAFIASEIFALILLALFLILGISLENNIFYILMVIPVILGVVFYLVYYFLTKKKVD